MWVCTVFQSQRNLCPTKANHSNNETEKNSFEVFWLRSQMGYRWNSGYVSMKHVFFKLSSYRKKNMTNYMIYDPNNYINIIKIYKQKQI